MKKVIITGGSGFIGTNLVEYYAAAGHEVFNLDIAKPRNPLHTNYWHKVDILDAGALIDLVREINPDRVFHLAARTDLNGKCLNDYSANIQGVSNIVLSIKEVDNIESVVFASSMLVCRLGYQPLDNSDYCPDTIYGQSKVIGERIVREASLDTAWTIVRPTSIWGPWFDTPYKNFFDVIRKGLYVHPLGLRVKRSYGFVLNAVYQLANISDVLDDSLYCETVYLADYKAIELKNWAVTIQQALSVGSIREVPRWIFKAAAWGGDVAKRLGFLNPPMTSFRYKNMITETVLDTRNLECYCKDLPYSMQQGVSITCKWLIDQEDMD